MKRILLMIVAFAFVGNVANVSGQTPASATWTLLSDPPSADVTGNITAGNQSLGSYYIQSTANNSGGSSDIQYNSGYGTAANNNQTSGWQRVGVTSNTPSPYNANAYVQYTVSPTAGNNLTVTEVKGEIVGGGTGSARLVAKYSTDGTNFSDMPVAGTYNNAAAPATEASPVTLINGGSGIPVLTGQQFLTFTGMSISVPAGQTFYVRYYVYLTGASATIRHLGEKNISISGTTVPASTTPLDFLAFNAKLNSLGNQVKLDWSTANEVNTSSFAIERSTYGTFSTIGTVASKNASGKQSYSFVDNNPAAGTSYYRLTQTDKDGKSKTFDKIITIENNGGVSLSVSPNPANTPSVSVSHPAASVNASIKVVNLQGQVVASASPVAGDTKTSMSVSDLASGLYIVSFENGGSKLTYKFVKK